MKLVSYEKNQNKNEVVIKVLLSPTIPIFNTIDYSQSFVPSFPIQSSNVDYDPKTGLITYTFNY